MPGRMLDVPSLVFPAKPRSFLTISVRLDSSRRRGDLILREKASESMDGLGVYCFGATSDLLLTSGWLKGGSFFITVSFFIGISFLVNCEFDDTG